MFRKIQLLGNVGRDPEIRNMDSGSMVANFSVACNDTRVNKATQEKQTFTTWFRIVVWQTGETGLVTGVIQPYVRKGQLLFIDGTPTLREYEQDGQKKTVFEVRIDQGGSIRMVGGRPNGADKEAPAGMTTAGGAGGSLPDDNIPF